MALYNSHKLCNQLPSVTLCNCLMFGIRLISFQSYELNQNFIILYSTMTLLIHPCRIFLQVLAATLVNLLDAIDADRVISFQRTLGVIVLDNKP